MDKSFTVQDVQMLETALESYEAQRKIRDKYKTVSVRDLFNKLAEYKFKAFQATKKEMSASEAAALTGYEALHSTKALVYMDRLVIEKDTDTDGYFLLIENTDYTDDYLEKLERLLYAYAKECGVIE